MSCDYVALATAGVQGLQPYQPGKPIEELQRELGLSQIVKLASNENPLGPSAVVTDCLSAGVSELTRYPDGSGFALKGALSAHLSVEVEQITLGNGSNDILELLARAYLGPDSSAVYSQHAFVVYPLAVQAVGARGIEVPALNWGHDLEAMAQAIEPSTRLVFIANPNNPTGTWVGEKALCEFLQRVPEQVIVVLDEAYFEYACHGDFDYPDGLGLLERFPNLVVTRTFSKAYGLAGLRVGYCISNPAIADVLNRIRAPFNVNSLALAAAEAVLGDGDYLQRGVDINRQGLSQLGEAFTQRGLDYIESAGNFISVAFDADVQSLYAGLLREGVIVRPVANYGMSKHLRVSIGLESENQQFLQALDKVLPRV